jgi:hypothetical protein
VGLQKRTAAQRSGAAFRHWRRILGHPRQIRRLKGSLRFQRTLRLPGSRSTGPIPATAGVFDHVSAALVHGSGYERHATPGCSDRTIRRRLTDWAKAGHAKAMLRSCWPRSAG